MGSVVAYGLTMQNFYCSRAASELYPTGKFEDSIDFFFVGVFCFVLIFT